MGRLPLRPGTAGEIHVKQVGKSWAARCRYRHEDGSYEDVRRRGRNKELAKQALRDAIKEIVKTRPGAQLDRYSHFSKAASLGLASTGETRRTGSIRWHRWTPTVTTCETMSIRLSATCGSLRSLPP